MSSSHQDNFHQHRWSFSNSSATWVLFVSTLFQDSVRILFLTSVESYNRWLPLNWTFFREIFYRNSCLSSSACCWNSDMPLGAIVFSSSPSLSVSDNKNSMPFNTQEHFIDSTNNQDNNFVHFYILSSFNRPLGQLLNNLSPLPVLHDFLSIYRS